MKIKKLRIQNFRSFGPALVEIDLSKGSGYFVVVGPNASGKSNFLEALRWVTLDKPISGDYIEPWDFHKGLTENNIKIEAELDPPLKRGDTFNKFSDIGLLRLEAKKYQKGVDKGSIRCDHPALTCDGAPVMTGQVIPLAKGRSLTEEEKEAKQKPRPLLVREIKEELPIYYLDNISYEYHLSMRAGSLMSRLSRMLHDDLIRDQNRIEWQGVDRSRAEAIDSILSELSNLLKTDRSKEILGTMSDFLSEQLQVPKGSVGLEIGLPSGMDLLRKLDLLAKDQADMPMVPLERLGRGYSALGIVALFRALNKLEADHQGAVVLIEEPELFLGPHLRAVFATTLQKFAQNGNQVIVITHSSEFFNPVNPETAILVQKIEGASQVIQWPKEVTQPSFDINIKLIEPNLSKMIFSKKILFVEGADDYAAAQTAFEMLNISSSYHGLEILRLEGKSKIEHFGTYVKNFNIPFAALLDADAQPHLIKIDSTGSCWRLMNPDLEGALSIKKQSSENSLHVVTAIKAYKNWEDLKKNCPDFAKPLEQVLRFLGIIK